MYSHGFSHYIGLEFARLIVFLMTPQQSATTFL
ncbi:DedA family protein [Corynebacterium pseudotuberculosis]|nr:DedA family protein [Corynebacterium pseudotuberculosis]